MGRTDGLILERISADALREATGRDWDEWLEALDAAGAEDLSHKEIVSHLDREHGDETNSWWRQSIAVGYEQARGKRELGQTRDVGFQVGVQRSVAASRAEAWKLLTSRPELWLGEGRPWRSRRANATRCPRRATRPLRAARFAPSSHASACG